MVSRASPTVTDPALEGEVPEDMVKLRVIYTHEKRLIQRSDSPEPGKENNSKHLLLLFWAHCGRDALSLTLPLFHV